MASRRVCDLSPRELLRTPRELRSSHEIREVRLRRREAPLVTCEEDERERRIRREDEERRPWSHMQGDESRRIKKEIRLERRLRRRAESAATDVWRNSLLIAGAVSLCVAGVTALAVALAIRH
jgi:hypothetical protein